MSESIEKLLNDTPTSELVENYWDAIEHVMKMIRASEVKAGLILSFYGIVLGLVFERITTMGEIGTIQPFIYVIITAWAYTVVASIYFSFKCFMPRIEGNYEKNVFFFGDAISAFGDINEYSQKLLEVTLNSRELYKQLGHQIYINSKIAGIKFKNVNRSIRYLAISFMILIFLAFFYVITK